MSMKDYVAVFSRGERIGHWSLAISLFILFFTNPVFSCLRGLQQFLGGISLAFFIHHITGIIFFISLGISFLAWIKDGWPDRQDWDWLKKGKYFSGLPNEGRFNTIQKLYFFGVIFFGILASLSGLIIWKPSVFNRQLVALGYALHSLSALFFAVTVIIHVYIYTLVNPRGLSGITFGWVSRSWANKQRGKWLARVEKEREDY